MENQKSGAMARSPSLCDDEWGAAGQQQGPSAEMHPPGLVKSIGFSTEAMPVGRQFDAWRDQCSSVIEITEATGPSPGYAARFEMWTFGHFALSAVVAPPTRFRRTGAHIRRDSLDHWMIHVAREGSNMLRTETADVRVATGQPHILSLDQVMEGERSDVDWLCLFVARDAFPGLGPALDASRDAPMDGAMAGLLGSYIQGLAANLPRMKEAELPSAVEATRAVVAACLASAAPAGAAAEAHVERARLGRIRQLIRQNLRSTQLGPERLCRLAGVSRSQLYRLFEPFGGVARYIQGERLAQAHRALSDPANTQDIIRVAEDVGFFDPSAFSRAFRREFGYSPTALRLSAATGWVAPPLRKASLDKARDFAGTLRQL